MSEESTPLDEPIDDTSAVEPETVTETVEDTSTNPEPETEDIEAEDSSEKDNKQDDPEAEKKLIFGKFSDLEAAEKGYKEAEKAIGKLAEYEKKLKAYAEAEEQAREQREIEARRMGFENTDALEVDLEVKRHELALYAQALDSCLSGENYDRAYEALNKYKQTESLKDLNEAKKYFDPEIIEVIAKNTALFQHGKMQELQNKQLLEKQSSVKNAVETFARENMDWIQPVERQRLVGAAVQALGADLDLGQLKTFIDDIERCAIERYVTEQKAKEENNIQKSKLQTPSAAAPAVSSDKDEVDWQSIEDPQKMRELLRSV